LIDEILRCRDCGTEHDHYNDLYHPGEDTGGFCRHCGGDDIEEVDVATFATGDGTMARLMANGLCPKCKTALKGEMKCNTCGLEIVNV